MSKQTSNIQLEDTDYRGITRYYHPDWNIEAYNIDRRRIKNKEYKDLNIQGHSIYFLYGEDENEDEKLSVYVGRSSETKDNIPVFTRLYQHHTSVSEKYRDKWDSAIAISFKNLTFDEMRNLENYFFRALLPEVKLNDREPDTNRYKYEGIQHKVEYIKAFVKHILKVDIFSPEKKQETPKDIPALVFTEAEMRNGGKRLVDKDFEIITEVQTPMRVIDQMLDMLPPQIWNPNTKFLDLACKSGEFIKAIFNRLLASPLYNKNDFPNEAVKTLYIISEQIYGIALTDTSYKLSLKNINKKANIIKIDNFSHILKLYNALEKLETQLNQAKSSGNTKLIKPIEKKIETVKTELSKLGIKEVTIREYVIQKFGEKEMKFDVVIGNPPYQDSSKSIYNEFIDSAISLGADHINMIVKNNWLTSDTLKSTRINMQKTGIKEIINYPKMGDIFPYISAAVSIFYLQKGYSGETEFKEYIKKDDEFVKTPGNYKADLRNDKVIVSDKMQQNIINKFSNISINNDFGTLTYPAEPFRINSNGMVGRGASTYKLRDYDTQTAEHNVAVVYMNSNKKPFNRYTSIKDIPNRVELVSKYKVICGKIITKDEKVINNIHVLNPNTVSTSSWGLLFASDSLEEAVNVKKYVQTKLFRFLVRCLGEDGLIAISAYRFSLVPLQDFTNNSDIDWSQSVQAIGKKLYKKYNLTVEEINFIETTIRPMESKPTPHLDEQVLQAHMVEQLINNK